MLPVIADEERLRKVCERFGVTRLEVFGSVARGTDRSDSDVDVLYTLAPGTRIGWEIEDLAAELQEILQRPVDLVSRRSLNERIRDDVLHEARIFHGAA